MSRVNYFAAPIDCPHCGRCVRIAFEADIGVLDLTVFELGELVILTVPPQGKAIGPAVYVDWERPFWAVGFGICPNCKKDVTARIVIRDRRFAAANPTRENLDTFAWGQLA